jgi:hypothetical protein
VWRSRSNHRTRLPRHLRTPGPGHSCPTSCGKWQFEGMMCSAHAPNAIKIVRTAFHWWLRVSLHRVRSSPATGPREPMYPKLQSQHEQPCKPIAQRSTRTHTLIRSLTRERKRTVTPAFSPIELGGLCTFTPSSFPPTPMVSRVLARAFLR